MEQTMGNTGMYPLWTIDINYNYTIVYSISHDL